MDVAAANVNELRPVLTGGDHDLEPMVLALRGVILSQAFPQMVRLDAHDGIQLRVELWISAQDIQGDRVFLDLAGSKNLSHR